MTERSKLESTIVNTDRRLNRAATQASEDLARWRWHWTLDELNEERVAFAEYARLVALHPRTIATYAYGYKFLKEHEVETISDGLERARLGADTYAAAQAVAEERGSSVAAVRGHRLAEVHRVRDTARHRATARGTSLAQEARQVAREVARPVQTDEDEATSYLNGAAREIAHALAARERAGIRDENAERDALLRIERYLAAYHHAVKGTPFEDSIRESDREWLESVGVTL